MRTPNFPDQAVWIGSDHAFDLHEAYLRFRSPAGWTLNTQPKTAELFITADSRYKLWVNGDYVARGPARCFPQAQVVDVIDIAPFLRAGANTLAVAVYQPGYSTFAYVHRGMAGLLAHLVCDGDSVLATDVAWRTRRDPSFAELVPRQSIYQAGVEVRDLKRTEPWTESEFDDSDWSAARLVAPAYGYPWTSMKLRSLPLLQERAEAPMQLISSRRGPASTASDDHLALRQDWTAGTETTYEQQSDGWFPVALAAGESAVWLFDLGRGYTCQGWAEAEGASGEEKVRISYTEKIRDGEPYLSDPETYCRVRMTDRFDLRPGDQRIEGFSPRGGRLVLFQVVGPTGPDFRIRFHTRTIEYPLEITRPLVTTDPLLNKIVALCEDTLRSCLFDGYVDNPWRESAQWIGDALPDSLILTAMCDDVRPMRRVLEMAVEGAYPDGVLPSVLPSEAHAYVVVDFNFQWVELLHHYWRQTQDAAFLARLWPALTRMLDRFSEDIDADGLISSQPGRRLFLDWSPMSKREPNAAYHLHFLLAVHLAAKLAQDLGYSQDAERWQALAQSLQAAARRAFWQDGRWYDDAEHSTFSQLSASLAVLTRSALPHEVSPILDAVSARSLNPSDEAPEPGATPVDPNRMVLASPYMHHRVFSALRQEGRAQTVLEIIKLRWGRWVEGGYPTVWENWSVDFPDGSECHGFSAHPRYHLAEIARDLGGL